MWQKVEVVWVDGSVRLLGASASEPAMGCGGSKAQPASEVELVPCFCFVLFCLVGYVRLVRFGYFS